VRPSPQASYVENRTTPCVRRAMPVASARAVPPRSCTSPRRDRRDLRRQAPGSRSTRRSSVRSLVAFEDGDMLPDLIERSRKVRRSLCYLRRLTRPTSALTRALLTARAFRNRDQ
jgi:hypothetical protein